MLPLLCLALWATLMTLARRRADLIRLRVERQWGQWRPATWEAWGHATRQPHFKRDAWWREPY